MTNRLGIFGGSFNPIHFGHLRSAEEIRLKFLLGKVLFVPTYVPPHKPADSVLAYRHRKTMTQAAISSNPYFVLEETEETLPAPSYTYRTIQALTTKYGKDVDFYFILGEDDFACINTWNSPELIFSACTVVVITRRVMVKTLLQLLPVDQKDEFWYSEKEGVLVHKNGKKVHLSYIPVLDISSSRIRSLVKEKKSIRYLTPETVVNYIEKEKLYY